VQVTQPRVRRLLHEGLVPDRNREKMPHDEGRRKAGIILIRRIKYQEAAGLEVKRGRPPKTS